MYEFEVGDRVKLIEQDDFGIVYEKKDNLNNVLVFYKNEVVKVNIKRIELEGKATDLYPEGYDLNSLFVSYAERKFQHDMERGSKKALKKVSREIKKRLNE